MEVGTAVEDFRFSLIDYFIFGAMIALSVGIGIYFGYFKRTTEPSVEESEPPPAQKNEADFGSDNLNEYLLGSRQMHPFPIAMSLVASYISGITVLGTPAEIYYYGTQYWLVILPMGIMGLVVSFVYLPVYHALGVSSSYQYLALRFHPYMTTFAAFMFIIDELFFLPVIVYGPAISFNQVSGTNIYVISFILCLSCVMYTLVGGIKAVVSTDAWQTIIMFLSVVTIVVYGLASVEGIEGVVSKNKNSAQDRLVFFNFSPSLYERNTFWSMIIGALCYWTSFNAVNQTMVQRYMAVSSVKKAQCAVAIFVCSLIPFVSLCCFVGLQIYAFYKDCDPLTAGLITADDQIFTIYVMQSMGDLKGVAGIFMAGVVGAALSSLSTVLNSTSAIIYEDILKGFFKLDISKEHSALLVRILVVALTIITFCLVFIIEKLGSILSAATTFSSIAASTTFGLFTLGMLIPWSNTIGALIGGLAGFLFTGWIAFGSQYIKSQRVLPSFKLPIEMGGCEGNFTVTTTPDPDVSDIFPLYRLSYFWISPIGVITVVIVGTIASFIIGPTDPKTIDRRLISPVLHRWFPTT